jgi:hypothetical protein
MMFNTEDSGLVEPKERDFLEVGMFWALPFGPHTGRHG